MSSRSCGRGGSRESTIRLGSTEMQYNENPALRREFQKEALSGPRDDQVSPSREELLFRAMGS